MLRRDILKLCFVTVVFGAVFAGGAQGATFSALADGCGASTGSPNVPSAGYTEHQVAGGVCDINGSLADGMAFAGPEALGAFGTNQKVCCGSATLGGGTASLFTYFTITGPAGEIPVGLSLALHSTAFDPDSFSSSYVLLNIDLYIGSFTTGRRAAQTISDGQFYNTGMTYLELNGDTPITVDPVPVIVGSPTALSITLKAQAWGGFTTGERVTINALNTLRFPRTGPVFILPDGYSVDVPDLYIVNNRFVDPNGGGTGEVPEPATLALTGLGLTFAAILRRKRLSS